MQEVAAVDLAPAVGDEPELVQYVLRGAVVVARDGNESLKTQGSEGLADNRATRLGRIAASPVGGAERIAKLDVQAAALKRLEPGLPDDVARFALEYRPK